MVEKSWKVHSRGVRMENQEGFPQFLVIEDEETLASLTWKVPKEMDEKTFLKAVKY